MEIAEIIALVGRGNVKTDAATCTSVVGSWSPAYTKRKQSAEGAAVPRVDAVVLPANTAEVAEVVRWANRTQTAIIPVGGASNIVESNLPPSGRTCIALDLLRLQTFSLKENNLTVRVGAGWSIAALEGRLGETGLTLGHFPGSANLCTVGGAVATGASGLLAGRYGTFAERTLALDVVLPRGEVLRTGRANPGETTPLNLFSLFSGSEGTLGVVTEATLRLSPVPDVRAWVVATFPDFVTATETVRLLYRTDARPACVRVLEGEVAQRHGAESGEALLLLCFEGDELVQTGAYQLAYALCQKMEGAMGDGEIGENWFVEARGTNIAFSANARPAGLADVWAVGVGWDGVAGLYAGIGAALAPLCTRVTVRLVQGYTQGACFEIVWEAAAEMASPESALVLYEKIRAAGAAVLREMGASVGHHYGVGAAAKESWESQSGAVQMEALRQIKRALDPLNILNPERLQG